MLSHARRNRKKELDIPTLEAKLLEKGRFNHVVSFAIGESPSNSEDEDESPSNSNPSTNRTRRQNMTDKVLLYGLFEPENQEGLEYTTFYYSFCADAWADDVNINHCLPCGKCVPWRAWHCATKGCNQCWYGVSIPCEKCGGVSDMYHSIKKDERHERRCS